MKNKKLLILALILAPSVVLLGAALSEILQGQERWRRLRARLVRLGERESFDPEGKRYEAGARIQRELNRERLGDGY